MENQLALNRCYAELIHVASSGVTITVQEIAAKLGYPARGKEMAEAISNILHRICVHEHSKGRPLLTALVVKKPEYSAGPGFFKQAIELGVWDGKKPEGCVGAKTAKELFLESELRKVYAEWSIQ